VETEADLSERKLATLIFADLVGSTTLGASQDPERTRSMLSRFFAAMGQEIDLAGGTVEKFAGDAVMAAFGVPAALEDHAERALHAALAMQRRLRDEFGDSLAIRIGVNTGEVVIGKPLEGSSFVTGDAVNAAARLEQAAAPGEILVGERTVASVRGAFEFAAQQSVPAKGFPEGVPARRLTRALSLMRPRGVQGLQRTFVGRDGDMAVLDRSYDEAVATRLPRLVTIVGDAGVGKSRLVREFWERLGAREPEPVRRAGRCLAYGQGTTYWPMAEVLKEHLGIGDSESPDAILERLGERRILGMTLGLDVGGDLHPLAARDQLQDAWVEFMKGIAAERPVVMLIEDLHWADDLLVDLLERLLADASGPILVLVTARPELLDQRPRWGARANAAVVTLEPLAHGGALELLGGLLGGTLPEGLATVADRAEGNPFFVEELLGTLIDRQLLARSDGAWEMAELPADFEVPDTVQAVVAARMDLLDPTEKQALQAAAVIGRVFWAEPVYELVPEGAPDLRVLEERDFIRRRPGSSLLGQREFAIKHALIREVAYDSLPRARRAVMHAGFAKWAEQVAGSPDELAPILAHHYAAAVQPADLDLAWSGREAEAAELRAQAIGWLRRAAQLAVGRMEIPDAIALLHRALELETDPIQQAAIWREVGRASILQFDGLGFWTALQTSLELDPDPATSADVYGELAVQTSMRRGMWKVRPDDELIQGWIDRALELAEPGSAAQARGLIAKAWVTGDNAQLEDARRLAETLDDERLRWLFWYAMAEEAGTSGAFDEAVTWDERQIEGVPEGRDPDWLAWVLTTATLNAQYAGRFAEARTLAERNAQVSSRLTPHHRLHGVGSLVSVAFHAGEWADVQELSPRVEAAFQVPGATPCIAGTVTLFRCAVAWARTGRADEAERLLRVADYGQEGFGAWTDPQLITLAIIRGDRAELERRLADWRPDGLADVEGHIARLDGLVLLDRREAIEAEAPPLLLPGMYIEPFALRALGFARRDAALYDQAIAAFDRMGLDWFAAQTRSLQSEGRLEAAGTGTL
jgi:class 3 adenylate cyclase/tetratricopeptide (TPR) repeat protein